MNIDVSYEALLQALVVAIRPERDHGTATMSLVSRLVDEACQQDWFEAHWRTDARLKLAQMACGHMPDGWRSAGPVLEVIAEAARWALKADEIDGEARASLLAIARLADVERSGRSAARPKAQAVANYAGRHKANGAAPVRRRRAATQLAKPATAAQPTQDAKTQPATNTAARKTKRTKPMTRSRTMKKLVKPAAAQPKRAAKPATKTAARKTKRAKPMTRSRTTAKLAKPAAARKAAAVVKTRPATKTATVRKTKRAKPAAARKATAVAKTRPATKTATVRKIKRAKPAATRKATTVAKTRKAVKTAAVRKIKRAKPAATAKAAAAAKAAAMRKAKRAKPMSPSRSAAQFAKPAAAPQAAAIAKAPPAAAKPAAAPQALPVAKAPPAAKPAAERRPNGAGQASTGTGLAAPVSAT